MSQKLARLYIFGRAGATPLLYAQVTDAGMR